MRLGQSGQRLVRIPDFVHRFGDGASLRHLLDLLTLFFFLFQLLSTPALLLLAVLVQGHLDLIIHQIVGKLFGGPLGGLIFDIFQMVLFSFIGVRFVKSLSCRFRFGMPLTRLLRSIACPCDHLICVVSRLR